jgi:hypothetical protein
MDNSLTNPPARITVRHMYKSYTKDEQ